MGLLSKLKNFIWSKRFLKQILIIIGVYLLVIFATIWYLKSFTNHGEKITVPNLIGKNIRTVKGQLEGLNLKFEVLDSIYDPSKLEGTVLFQNPGPTSLTSVFVKEERTIRLRVSKRSRMVEMPQLVDKSQRFAESILRNRGFRFKVEYKTTTEADGAVMSQQYNGKEIAAKTKLPIGSTIKIVVGRNLGSELIPVPNLIGLTIFEARDRLVASGSLTFVPVCPDCFNYQDSVVARIESQSPEFIEGAMTASNGTITVYAKKNLDTEQ